MTKKLTPETQYQNNPFFVASSGITLLFNLARNLAILFIILSVLSLFSNNFSQDENANQWNDTVRLFSNWTVGDWTLAVGSFFIIGLAIMLISALFGGVSSYTSYQLSRGKEVTISEAFRNSFEHLWSYLWLQIIVGVKIFLWALLFIIPGIIMAVRYSLAGVAFYDDKKKLRGNAAVKESLRLTRGAWLTTYASSLLFNILTLGAISSLVSTGVNAVLYKQFDHLDDKKPAAHWLSWVTLFIPFVLIGLALMILMAIIVGIALAGY